MYTIATGLASPSFTLGGTFVELPSLATHFHSPLQCGHHKFFSVSHNFTSVVVVVVVVAVVPSNVDLMSLCQRTSRYCVAILIFMQEFDEISFSFLSFTHRLPCLNCTSQCSRFTWKINCPDNSPTQNGCGFSGVAATFVTVQELFRSYLIRHTLDSPAIVMIA